MNKTINADKITRVIFTPLAESKSLIIIPEHYRSPELYCDDLWECITRKKILVSAGVGYDITRQPIYSLEEFQEYHNEKFIQGDKVFNKCNVTIDFISGHQEVRYFSDTPEGVKFYDEVIAAVKNKISY